jgi:hypothetical protein
MALVKKFKGVEAVVADAEGAVIVSDGLKDRFEGATRIRPVND